MNTHVSYVCGKYPILAKQYYKSKREVDNTQNIQDRMERAGLKDDQYRSAIAIGMVQSWLNTSGALEELAHMLNERDERGGQIFEQSFDCLYWLDENEIYVEPNSEALNNNGGEFIQLVLHDDMTKE